jgi:mannose-6-phosphate isomerase-like protein (cupin superfamily)
MLRPAGAEPAGHLVNRHLVNRRRGFMEATSLAPALFRASEARQVPHEAGRISARVFAHGSMELRWYAPPRIDPQVPHPQDELYIVASGRGVFTRAGEKFAFGPGDALFVAAGVEHRFEEFTDDFATWVVFYGPRGGEALDNIGMEGGA